MRPTTQTEAQRIVGCIEAGTASQSDVVTVLIYLREDLDDSDPVKDISHCIAHSKRDKGIAFKFIEHFVDEFVAIVQYGGLVKVNVLFPLDEVIQRLIDDLQDQGLTVQPNVFRRQSALLCKHLGDILNGVSLKLPNTHVVECRFATADTNPQRSFNVKFRGLEKAKVLQIPANVAMAFPVLVG
jgi:hypothetical protein